MKLKAIVQSFEFTKVLKSDPQTKHLVLLGTVNGQSCIVALEKSPFNAHVQFDLIAFIKNIRLIEKNHIYYWAAAEVKQKVPELPGAKVTVIYPATETHIRKYSPQTYHYVLETPEMYKNYVAPYIDSMKGERLKWVYNILFEGKESESVVCHETDPITGFVLLPDMKWDRITMAALYLCCIVTRQDISSIRDLNGSHVEFLKRLRSTILKITSEKYGISRDQLRLFIHYQPSYYHFHIHVVSLKRSGLNDGISVGKAILLDDIIDNITLASDYYQKKTIGYILGDNHGLWKVEGYRNANNV